MAFDVVIVTGSREWMDIATIERAIAANLKVGGLLIHGDAAGADRIADHYAKHNRIRFAAIPYFSWMGKAGGPARNSTMLDVLLGMQAADEAVAVLAFHDDPDVLTSRTGGTADMVRKARRANVPCLLFRSEATHG